MILLFAHHEIVITTKNPDAGNATGALAYVREDLAQLGLPYADSILIHTPAAHGNQFRSRFPTNIFIFSKCVVTRNGILSTPLNRRSVLEVCMHVAMGCVVMGCVVD
jgi:diketogulonate reductase-like aldo/keto reductase